MVAKLASITTLAGRHNEIILIIKDRTHWNDGTDLLTRSKLEQIDDVHAPGRSAGFRNLVTFQPVCPAFIGEKSDKVVGVCHKDIPDIIIFDHIHAPDTLSATVLALMNDPDNAVQLGAGHTLQPGRMEQVEHTISGRSGGKMPALAPRQKQAGALALGREWVREGRTVGQGGKQPGRRLVKADYPALACDQGGLRNGLKDGVIKMRQ